MTAAAIILLIAAGCGIFQQFRMMWALIGIAVLILILRFLP